MRCPSTLSGPFPRALTVRLSPRRTPSECEGTGRGRRDALVYLIYTFLGEAGRIATPARTLCISCILPVVLAIFILFLGAHFPPPSSPFVLSSAFPLRRRNSQARLPPPPVPSARCEIAEVWRETTTASHARCGRRCWCRGISLSRTYLRDGTCASAIFHYSRKVREGCTLRNQVDTRHRNYFRVSRRHNSVFPFFYIL